MKQQVLFIHGGEVFGTYDEYFKFLENQNATKEDFIGKKRWAKRLQDDLGNDYEVFLPQMPCSWNAKYAEWKIWFEKSFPYLQDGIILAGGSLGGIFLAKYLSENDFPVKIKNTYLIAAPFDDKKRTDIDYTLGDFSLPESLEKLGKQAGRLYLYHSKDDPVVPFADMEKYAAKLPIAEKVIFEDKGHFNLEEFPELVDHLKSLK